MSKTTTKPNRIEQFERHIDVLHKALEAANLTIETLTKALNVANTYTPFVETDEQFNSDFASQTDTPQTDREEANPTSNKRMQFYAKISKDPEATNLTDDVVLD